MVAVLVLVGVIAVACTTGSPGTDTTASAPTTTPGTSQTATPQVPTWPDGALPPEPSAAPKGVDLRPLLNPPPHRPPDDDSAPIDPSKGIDNINHLVFIVMENRSFDEYFGTYPAPTGSR